MDDIRLRIVLGCGCPLMNNVADGVQAVLVVVRAGKQPEGSAPPPLHTLKLAEVAVGLPGFHAPPFIRAQTDVKRVAIT